MAISTNQKPTIYRNLYEKTATEEFCLDHDDGISFSNYIYYSSHDFVLIHATSCS